MIKGKVEAISVSNEDVEIYVMDEDNVSQTLGWMLKLSEENC